MISNYSDFTKCLHDANAGADHTTRRLAQERLLRLRGSKPDTYMKWQNKLRSEVRSEVRRG